MCRPDVEAPLSPENYHNNEPDHRFPPSGHTYGDMDRDDVYRGPTYPNGEPMYPEYNQDERDAGYDYRGPEYPDGRPMYPQYKMDERDADYSYRAPEYSNGQPTYPEDTEPEADNEEFQYSGRYTGKGADGHEEYQGYRSVVPKYDDDAYGNYDGWRDYDAPPARGTYRDLDAPPAYAGCSYDYSEL